MRWAGAPDDFAPKVVHVVRVHLAEIAVVVLSHKVLRSLLSSPGRKRRNFAEKATLVIVRAGVCVRAARLRKNSRGLLRKRA